MFDKGPRPEAFLLLKITYQSNPESTNWNFSFKKIVDRLLPPKWDNLVVSLPVLAFNSKATVVCSGEQRWASCPIVSPSRTSLGAMCQNLVVFGLRVDPNPELRHPPSPASLGERKGKVVHHARFGRNACLPGRPYR